MLDLTNLEVASGVVCNTEKYRWKASSLGASPVVALNGVLRPLLERPPFVVAFSGGRDSSVLLAAAARLASIEGLPPPAAVTAFLAGDSDSDERAWQELVIRSLGITDWERFDAGTDLDLLGPFACEALRRHGLFWPAPAYALIPLLRAARGGALVSGEGGDEIFGWWPLAKLRSAVAARRRPSRRSILDLAVRSLPYAARYEIALRSVTPYQTWLQPEALEAQRAALGAERAAQPLSWPNYLAQQATSRDLRLTVRTLEAFGAAEGAQFVAPFLSDSFVASLARFGGRVGLGDRSAVMTAAFSDLLPREVLTRVSKASFGRVFWGPQSRQFAAQWSGKGLSTSLVRVEDLRHAWLSRLPVYGSAVPLHAAWLACEAGALGPPRGVDL